MNNILDVNVVKNYYQIKNKGNVFVINLDELESISFSSQKVGKKIISTIYYNYRFCILSGTIKYVNNYDKALNDRDLLYKSWKMHIENKTK